MLTSRKLNSLYLLLISLIVVSQPIQATEIRIAVASNFYHSIQTLIDVYSSKLSQTKLSQTKLSHSQHQNKNTKFIVSSGATGTLYSQIVNGAPFDIFFSADAQRPMKLEKNHRAYYRQTYAIGKLALWSLAPEVTDVNALNHYQGRLAIANEKLAPFGKAAMQSMNKLEVTSAGNIKLLRANNINQAFQFVDTGNVKIAFVAESQLLQAYVKFNDKKYLRYALVSEKYHSAIKQQLVILNRGQQEDTLEEAKRFIEFILSPKGQSKLVSMGYKPVKNVI